MVVDTMLLEAHRFVYNMAACLSEVLSCYEYDQPNRTTHQVCLCIIMYISCCSLELSCNSRVQINFYLQNWTFSSHHVTTAGH